MKAVTGTWQKGQIVLDTATDWPEGCRVFVEPVEQTEKVGLSDDEVLDTPEAIADWLQWFDSFEPVELTSADEAAWAAARKAVKEYTISTMQQPVEGLFE